MAEKKVSFEEAFEKLKKAEEKIASSENTLDDSIKAFEEGVKNYKICTEILNEAKGKIKDIEKDL